MRLTVDYDRCESNGICMAFAPDLFEISDDDLPVVLDQDPAEALRNQADAAVAGCPKAAISLEG